MNTKESNVHSSSVKQAAKENHYIHGLVYDPIPFAGGSKIATLEMLMATKESLINNPSANIKFTIVTSDPQSWKAATTSVTANIITLPNWSFLTVPQGLRYWIAQLTLALMLLITLIREPKIHYAVGASNPGIDMALYMVQWIWRMPIIQLVHGPVGLSRSIGYCFTRAESVFYLASSLASIQNALHCYFSKTHDQEQAQIIVNAVISDARFESFINGLTQTNWPTQSNTASCDLFWAASLLKWKGLETLCSALDIANKHTPWNANICYITPQNTHLGISTLPTENTHTKLFHAPNNLDKIRANSGIFVSTSHNEPFGLSVLESLAAGLCVVIPNDGAYWDQALEHNVNCVKFNPQDPQSLYNTVQSLIDNPQLRRRLSQASLETAMQYRADRCYQSISIAMSAHIYQEQAISTSTSSSLETSHD
ncbi:glycosyltransferase family 4 protein [Vibrio sp. D404a]|uniref:glycosyltransferase family 4 protein n=1 Tax=unclassified Vibrio TaxID=2614977 RepID=UPI00255359E6|nr:MULTISPECIES: glycosyltransferase family 4 protein [unclassified Vibrio]MDK9735879.1 glycosyltransferase family 4 protein [Vibrio sp. D404a]MDK9796743.1 glycosyltransferase family 4 protein [Vibrio sp. D449a]